MFFELQIDWEGSQSPKTLIFAKNEEIQSILHIEFCRRDWSRLFKINFWCIYPFIFAWQVNWKGFFNSQRLPCNIYFQKFTLLSFAAEVWWSDLPKIMKINSLSCLVFQVLRMQLSTAITGVTKETSKQSYGAISQWSKWYFWSEFLCRVRDSLADRKWAEHLMK